MPRHKSDLRNSLEIEDYMLSDVVLSGRGWFVSLATIGVTTMRGPKKVVNNVALFLSILRL